MGEYEEGPLCPMEFVPGHGGNKGLLVGDYVPGQLYLSLERPGSSSTKIVL